MEICLPCRWSQTPTVVAMKFVYVTIAMKMINVKAL